MTDTTIIGAKIGNGLGKAVTRLQPVAAAGGKLGNGLGKAVPTLEPGLSEAGYLYGFKKGSKMSHLPNESASSPNTNPIPPNKSDKNSQPYNPFKKIKLDPFGIGRGLDRLVELMSGESAKDL